MSFAVLQFPNIDPVMLALGPIEVRWYGMAYAAGLLLGWQLVRWLLSTPRFWPSGQAPFHVDQADKLLLMMAAGIVVGGRLGYVLFYKPEYFMAASSARSAPFCCSRGRRTRTR
jgi:phosphatidylglycerol---prolipoprotein diacylglyceryl transferase